MKKYPHGLTLNAVCAAIDDYQRHEDSVPEEGILAAFNTLLGHSDIAEAFRALEQENSELRQQRAGLAKEANDFEAKLAELAKQEPVGSFHIYDGRVDGTTDYVRDGEWPINDGELLVYARPASAADLTELVPDAFRRDADFDDDSLFDIGVEHGWNACRAAILRNIEEYDK